MAIFREMSWRGQAHKGFRYRDQLELWIIIFDYIIGFDKTQKLTVVNPKAHLSKPAPTNVPGEIQKEKTH